MRNLIRKHRIPPFKDEKDFEDFIVDYFNDLEKVKSFAKYGKRGQKQNGIDIYSVERKIVIQCKVREQYSAESKKKEREKIIKELEKDLANFKNFKSQNEWSTEKFIFATTLMSDTILTNHIVNLSDSKKLMTIPF
jgi:hypothetical protein